MLKPIDDEVCQKVSMINDRRVEEQIKQVLSTFVTQLPLIAIAQATSLIENGENSGIFA